MVKVYNSAKYGEIVYEESFWSGRRKITINGNQLEKVNRTTFACVENDVTYSVVILGTFFIGVKLIISNSANPDEKEIINVVEGFKWYEFVFAFAGLVFIIAWNFVPAEIFICFPVMGGAVGGATGALCGFGGLYFAGKFKKWWQRIFIALAGSIICIIACWMIGLSILSI